MKTHFKKLLFTLLTAAFFSCETEENLPVLDEQNLPSESTSVDPRFIRYLEAIGFNEISQSDITETDDSYVVEGDIAFLKTDLNPIYDEMEKLKGKGLQWRYNIMVTTPASQYTTFKYQFDFNFPESLKSSIREAFLKWNQIRNYKIKFEETTTGNYNTIIKTFSSSAYADALPPTSTSGGAGKVGERIRINTSLYNGLTHSQRVFITAHEIGHLMGFLHTDEGVGILVPGTYQSDSYSIMNSGTFNGPIVPSWTDFYYLDLLAIRYYYSYDTSEKPFYAYQTTYGGQGGWTTDFSSHGYGDSSYPAYKGVNGYIYTSSKTGSIPLYMYKDLNTNLEYMNTNPNLSTSNPNFTKIKTLGYVFNSSGTNRAPVYEYFNYTTGYYFTTLANDPTVTGPGWIGGGIAFYTMSLGS